MLSCKHSALLVLLIAPQVCQTQVGRVMQIGHTSDAGSVRVTNRLTAALKARGYSNVAIGKQLGVSEITIRRDLARR